MLNDYHKLRIKKETGTIFEDVEPAPDNAQAASVKTDAQAQHKEKEETTGTAPKADAKVTKSLVETFKKWVTDILNKFRNKSNRLVERNNRWLANVKGDLNNLDTANTTINIAKYENATSEKILADISSAKNVINTINPSNLPNNLSSPKNAQKFIFANIPDKIGDIDNFSGRIKQFMTFGNTEKTTLTSYSGDDAKTKISNMITFCEQYGDMSNRIVTELDNLKEIAAKKQQDIINTLGTQAQTARQNQSNNEAKPATESVLFEAETQNVQQGKTNVGNDKDNKDKLSASSVITSVVRDYDGAILTVIEKKYLDYIKVLSKLAPKKENQEPAKDTNTEENKNESVEETTEAVVEKLSDEEMMQTINESIDEFNIDDLL